MEDPDLYSLLGVARSASMEEIKRVYYKRANTEHPDKLQARLSPEAVSLRVVVA